MTAMLRLRYRYLAAVRRGSGEGSVVNEMIPTLAGSPLHQLSVEMYQDHTAGADGRCVRCGERSPCLPRRHSAHVIMAAGQDPRSYDRQIAPTGVVGYAVGGAGRHGGVPYVGFERDR
jgi:hypothetical protein